MEVVEPRAEASPGFEKELEQLINKYSLDNGSNTPDFILADYLKRCLYTFNQTMRRRDSWYRSEKAEGE